MVRIYCCLTRWNIFMAISVVWRSDGSRFVGAPYSDMQNRHDRWQRIIPKMSNGCNFIYAEWIPLPRRTGMTWRPLPCSISVKLERHSLHEHREQVSFQCNVLWNSCFLVGESVNSAIHMNNSSWIMLVMFASGKPMIENTVCWMWRVMCPMSHD